jgi:diguanylate cyclase (GGDEF)-like protein
MYLLFNQDKKNALLTRFCQFKDPELERRFLSIKLNQDRLITRLLLAVIAAVLSILLCLDHLVIKPAYWPNVALPWRAGLVFLCLVAIYGLTKLQTVELFRKILLTLTVVILVNLQGMVLLYKDDYFLHVLFDIIIIIAIYFSTIFTVLTSICICFLYAITGFLVIYLSKTIDAYSLFIVAMSLIATNIAGVIISVHENTLKRRFYSRKKILQDFAADMKNKAFLDPLTGINNRRAFYELFPSYLRMASRFSEDDSKVCFVLADIDHFKKINDGYGHDVGDQVLVSFADFLTKSIRPTDHVFRFGGEEFLIIFVGCSFASALQRAGELLKVLNDTPMRLDTMNMAVTASLGLSVLQISDTDVSVISRADKALYRAKNSGRNRLCVSE